MILFGVKNDFIWGKMNPIWGTNDFISGTNDSIWDTKFEVKRIRFGILMILFGVPKNSYPGKNIFTFNLNNLYGRTFELRERRL